MIKLTLRNLLNFNISLCLTVNKKHLDDDPEPDTRQFINNQIELLYRKIEGKLQDNLNDIQLMKQKINKIEDKEDQKSKSKAKDFFMKMCPQSLRSQMQEEIQKLPLFSQLSSFRFRAKAQEKELERKRILRSKKQIIQKIKIIIEKFVFLRFQSHQNRNIQEKKKQNF